MTNKYPAYTKAAIGIDCLTRIREHIDGYFEPYNSTPERINHLRDAQTIIRRAIEELTTGRNTRE